jgi:hypothetical protein
MFQKSSYILLISVTIVAITSCRKDFEYAPSAGNLEFSVDTVFLDTIFRNISSSTYTLKVYNNTRDDVLIPSIRLKNGVESAYRLNVDGLPGQFFENVVLYAQDSLFINIEATIERIPDAENSFLYTDVLAFDTDNFLQEIPLITLVKDAYFLFPETSSSGEKNTVILTVDGEGNETRVPGFILTEEELNFTNEKPYVIYGFGVVPEGKILTIDAGARVHFHNDAGLLIRAGAQLRINGALSNDQELLENEVIFEGDRLEPNFEDIPGQWSGIYIEKQSVENSISYLTLKNADVGLFVEGDGFQQTPTLTIKNTKIHNSLNHNLWAKNAHIIAQNVVLGGAGSSSLYCNVGGYYAFTHCTIANYWNKGFRSKPTLEIDNVEFNANGQPVSNDLELASFRNCIIDGNGMRELALRSNEIDTFRFLFEDCLLKYEDNRQTPQSDPFFNFNDTSYYNGIIQNASAAFFNPVNNDFRISQDSGVLNQGNPQWSTEAPNDILGKSRAVTSDLGAYQVIFKNLEE